MSERSEPAAGDGRVDATELAELDAGLPDEHRAARRRADAAADPDAAAVLDALAATRADLAALPAPDVPPAVAVRWDAALAAEAARPGPAQRRGSTGHGKTRPGGRLAPLRRWGLLAAATAALVAGAGLGALGHRTDPPAVVTRVGLVALGRASVGVTDLGDLADPARRGACLAAVAPAAVGERLLGGRRVVLDGHPGVLLVLATGTRGGLRIVTVDPACGPTGGTLLAQVTVG